MNFIVGIQKYKKNIYKVKLKMTNLKSKRDFNRPQPITGSTGRILKTCTYMRNTNIVVIIIAIVDMNRSLPPTTTIQHFQVHAEHECTQFWKMFHVHV